MSRHMIAVSAVAVVVGMALWLGLPEAVDDSETVDVSGPIDGASSEANAFEALTEWGEPNLAGIWRSAPRGAVPGNDNFDLATLEELYTVEARALMNELSAVDDPVLHCAPPAFPRAATLGKQIQIVQRPGFAFVLTEAYPVFRSIPTTGRPHTEEEYRYPAYMGDSTARWDGDTLVVDVISFNGEGWLASPEDRPTGTSSGVWPTSDAMRVVERWRRVDADTLEYRATVEDPRLLTAPWETPAVIFERQATDRIEEALCLMEDGSDTYLDRVD